MECQDKLCAEPLGFNIHTLELAMRSRVSYSLGTIVADSKVDPPDFDVGVTVAAIYVNDYVRIYFWTTAPVRAGAQRFRPHGLGGGGDLMDGEVTRALIVPAIIVAAASRRAACRAGGEGHAPAWLLLIGLSNLDADKERPALEGARLWFDIPVVYNNNRRAILAMEKGTPGERVLADAFKAWKQ